MSERLALASRGYLDTECGAVVWAETTRVLGTYDGSRMTETQIAAKADQLDAPYYADSRLHLGKIDALRIV